VKLPLRLTGSFDAARVTLAPFLDLQIIGVADPKQRGAAAGVRVPGFDISRDCVSRLTVKSLAARRRVRARAQLDPLKIDTRSNSREATLSGREVSRRRRRRRRCRQDAFKRDAGFACGPAAASSVAR